MEYTIIRSKRKTCSIQIYTDGKIIVRAPMKMSVKRIEEILQEKSHWIEKNQIKMINRGEELAEIKSFSNEELTSLKEKAKEIIPAKVEYFAKIMNVNYNNITIRHQKTRWGSCSGKGNLNFNCLLALCPDKVIDYVVVHELSHRKQMNHSKAFWQEVENVLPDYKDSYNWLKNNGANLMAKLR